MQWKEEKQDWKRFQSERQKVWTLWFFTTQRQIFTIPNDHPNSTIFHITTAEGNRKIIEQWNGMTHLQMKLKLQVLKFRDLLWSKTVKNKKGLIKLHCFKTAKWIKCDWRLFGNVEHSMHSAFAHFWHQILSLIVFLKLSKIQWFLKTLVQVLSVSNGPCVYHECGEFQEKKQIARNANRHRWLWNCHYQHVKQLHLHLKTMIVNMHAKANSIHRQVILHKHGMLALKNIHTDSK